MNVTVPWHRMALLLTLAWWFITPAHAGELSGFIAVEGRWFPQDALDPRQPDQAASVVLQPEYYMKWNEGRDSLTFVPFGRWDEHDDERTHGDIRELFWQHAGETWELRAGIGKVFWGVTESQHLVDIINQTDLVENPDGEEKLGQPMVNLSLVTDYGTFDFFVLPYFRERSFPGVEGRLRTRLPVDTDQAGYESDREERHVDGAIRWFHTMGDWDIGLSHFYGTSRDPRFLPGVNGAGEPVLIPFYDLIHQTGLDLQVTKGGWLWKLEAIHRSGQGEDFHAVTGGFEYTIVGILGTQADLGLLAEYLYDERGERFSVFEDDALVGGRLTFNDVQSTELLFGSLIDTDSNSRGYFVEASRRLGERWKLSVEGRAFSNVGPLEPSFDLRNDDYLQLELARYF